VDEDRSRRLMELQNEIAEDILNASEEEREAYKKKVRLYHIDPYQHQQNSPFL
jgi:ribosomal protein S7